MIGISLSSPAAPLTRRSLPGRLISCQWFRLQNILQSRNRR
jgi:hypothetical protein